MAVSIRHAFTSAKGDGTDATLLQPSYWNAVHSTSMASGNLLGRLTVGTGVFEEIPISAFMAAVLNSADATTFLAALGVGAATTGDVKLTLKTTADSGWLMFADQTIGNAGSGATYANAAASALYAVIWNNISDTYAPVTFGRGANAAADWAALKPMKLLSTLGRALGVSGAGSGLTSRSLAQILGEETHLTTSSEMPAHFHSASIYDPGHTHTTSTSGTVIGAATFGIGFGSYNAGGVTALSVTVNASATNIRVNSSNGLDTTNSTGGGAAHNNMQPTTFLNAMVKL